MISVYFQGKSFNITVIQVYALSTDAEEAEVEWFYDDLQDLLELTLKRDVLFIIGDWNEKVEIQEIPGVTAKFGLGVQDEAGQRQQSFSKRPHWSWQTPSSNNTRDTWASPDGQFAAKDGEALYSQQKEDLELTVTQIMNSLLQNSDLN